MSFPQDVAIAGWDYRELVPVDGCDTYRFPVTLAPSAVYRMGDAVGRNTTTGAYGLYASGNSDGTQNPEALIVRACSTDSAGNVYLGSVSGSSEYGVAWDSVTAHFGGLFDVSMLPTTGAGSLDAAGITKLAGRTFQNGKLLKF